MKKVFLLTVFSIMSICAFSQLIVRTYKNQAGTYDDYFKKWRFDEMKYSDISIVVERGYFQFDDQAQSLYRVVQKQGETLESNYKSTTWTCKDEKNLDCTVQIIHYFENKSNVFVVIYDKICYVYHIKEVEQNK